MTGHGVIRRYRDFLPVTEDTCIISLNEGGTPLIDARQIVSEMGADFNLFICLLYTSPSPRDGLLSRMPSSA